MLFRSMWEEASGLGCFYRYNSDLFTKETIAKLRANYETVLINVVENPDADLEMLETAIKGADQRRREEKQKALKHNLARKFRAAARQPIDKKQPNLEP